MSSVLLVNGIQQTGSDFFTLHYNPKHGALGDLMEAAFDNGLGKYGVFNSGASERAGEIFLEVSVNQLFKNERTNFANHSQGNLLLSTGLTSQNSELFGVL